MYSTKSKNVTSATEKLHQVLTEKSSSRIGRLIKNTQQVMIRQLFNEDSLTKELHKNYQKTQDQSPNRNPINVVNTVRIRKDLSLDEQIKQRNSENQDIIHKIVKNIKEKNLKFTHFDKELVLQLHNSRQDRVSNNTQHYNNIIGNNSQLSMNSLGSQSVIMKESPVKKIPDKLVLIMDEKRNDSGSALGNINGQVSRKKLKQGGQDDAYATNPETFVKRRKEYLYQKFVGRDKNLTLDFTMPRPSYHSVFKTVGRDQREFQENRLRYEIPGVGKYVPKYNAIENIEPMVTIPKAQLDRTRNLLMINLSNHETHMGMLPDIAEILKDQNKDLNASQRMLPNTSPKNMNSVRSKSQVQQPKRLGTTKFSLAPPINNTTNDEPTNIKIATAQLTNKKQQSVDKTNNHIELKEEAADDILSEQSPNPHDTEKSKEEFANQQQSILLANRKMKNNRSISQSPDNKSQSVLENGWNKAHGLLALDKQSERTFHYQKLVKVNDYRFNYMQLPQIYSNNKRVVGMVAFGKDSPRKELFKLRKEAPQYDPKYHLVQETKPVLVNMNVRRMKQVFEDVEM